MLTEPQSSVSVTTKWDGATAIVCGIDPITGYFFVGTKSVFNKTTPKIMYSKKQIDSSYSTQQGVAQILKDCLDYLPSLGISGVIQGDFLFTSSSKIIKQIGGKITKRSNMGLFGRD